MDSTAVTQQKLIESIASLSAESLSELARFIDYLHYKSGTAQLEQEQQDESQPSFLLSIAGLGSSGETDISERDEEILAQEIDPIYGWTSHRDRQP